jgi:steroid Delta-isomerase
MGTTSTIRQIIDRYLRAYEERDFVTCAAMFADDAVFEDPVGGRRFDGIDQIRAFLHSAPPEITITADLFKVVECGSDAMFHYAMEITGWRDTPISIEVFETIAMDEAGQIKSLRAFWNEDSIIHR